MAFTYTWQVGLEDVDHFGILFYPRVFVVFQRSTEALFREMDANYHDIAQSSDYNIPVVAANAEYIKPVQWGDTVKLEITTNLGETSFEFKAVGTVGSDKVITIERTHAVIDSRSNSPKQIPHELATILRSV